MTLPATNAEPTPVGVRLREPSSIAGSASTDATSTIRAMIVHRPMLNWIRRRVVGQVMAKLSRARKSLLLAIIPDSNADADADADSAISPKPLKKVR